MRDMARWRRLLAACWLGALLLLAAVVTAAAFSTLAAPDAGRFIGRLLAHEATLSLALGAVLLLLERQAAKAAAAKGAGSQFGLGVGLVLATLFCTVVGYFVLQPLMAEARAGSGRWSFGQLHAASAAFFGIKLLLVAALAWRAATVRN